MKHRILVILLSLTVAISAWGSNKNDSIATSSQVTTAREAFRRLPGEMLDLLTPTMRDDLLAYYDADTLRTVRNTLGGLSQLERPLNPSYLRCRVTPVSTVTFRVLKSRNKPIIAVCYTISTPGHAADSQIMFYDADMRPLKTYGYLELARVSDFLNVPHESHALKKQIEESIPFPTVEYTLSPDNDTLTARLTVEDTMGIEAYDRIKSGIRPVITYRWDGKRYHRQP